MRQFYPREKCWRDRTAAGNAKVAPMANAVMHRAKDDCAHREQMTNAA